jgi:hydrogenase maturation protease
MKIEMHHTLIAGIGNVLMGDDAIGPTVAAHLEARFAFPDGVKVADLGTPGIGLALHLAGLRTVVLIDAVIADSDPPGTIRVVRQDEIVAGGAAGGLDAHAPGLPAVLLMARETGGAPEQLSVIGVTAESCCLGGGLSEGVRRAVPGAIEAVAAELRRLGVPFTERIPPGAADLWWER